MSETPQPNWQGRTDGTPWMQRTLIGLLRYLPLGLLYGVMGLIIPFYMLLDRRGFRASYRFYRRRMAYGPLRSLGWVYRNEYQLGRVVLDRFASFAGKEFRLEPIEGKALFDRLSAETSGLLILSAHIGNYELAGYHFVSPKRYNALVFGGETAAMAEGREKRFARGHVRMIPYAEDLSHLFTLSGALADGEIVSMPADRIFGAPRSVRVPFFGAEAAFPAGPFQLAVSADVPLLSVFVMKETRRRYRVLIQALTAGEGSRKERVQALARNFAAQVEQTVRRYPDQWYNFYDFWA